ncbi:MAG: radical SAM protein, partial [Clostridium perfringens]|nr:radical SAM protein [Clostridium perfringens]
KRIVVEKNIKKLFFEAHWCYRNRLKDIEEYFGVPIIFKTGIETFDDHFRNDILNKNARFKDVEEVKKYFKSICLMVGIKGQTKDMIKRDMDLLLNNFKYGTVNIWTENTTSFKRDEELIKWFEKEYSFLKDNKTIEVLFENTDFGVGD